MNARGPTLFLQITFLHIMLITVTWLTAGSWCISWRKKVKALAKTLIALLLYRGFKVYQNTALTRVYVLGRSVTKHCIRTQYSLASVAFNSHVSPCCRQWFYEVITYNIGILSSTITLIVGFVKIGRLFQTLKWGSTDK